MEDLLRDFSRFSGAYIRHFFLKLAGRPTSIDELIGNPDDPAKDFKQACLNIAVGLGAVIIVAGIVILIITVLN